VIGDIYVKITIIMALEDQMKLEITHLEQEIKVLTEKIEKLSGILTVLETERKKKERDMRILKSSFGESERSELQTTLAGVI
jgi:TolA-binding protein